MLVGSQIFGAIFGAIVFGFLLGMVVGRWNADYEIKYHDELFDD